MTLPRIFYGGFRNSTNKSKMVELLLEEMSHEGRINLVRVHLEQARDRAINPSATYKQASVHVAPVRREAQWKRERASHKRYSR